MKTGPSDSKLEEKRSCGDFLFLLHFLPIFMVLLGAASPAWAVVQDNTFGAKNFWTTERVAAFTASLLFMTVCIMILWRYRSLLKLNRELRRNIAERKQAEEKISEQRVILEHILEQSLAGYWDWRKKEGMEYFSPTFKKMLGYEDHELSNIPETWRRLILPEDLPGVHEVFRKHVESHGVDPFYNEVKYRHKNGSVVWVICTGTVVEWDEDGQPLRMIGCHVDITRRKNLEAEIQKAHDELERRVGERTQELSELNAQLKTEIEVRRLMEDALLRSHEELERRVQERTSELAEANIILEDEIEHRRQADAALTLNQVRLRNLYLNLQSMREEERANIAREIHDELGQIMTAIKMDIAWIKGKYCDHESICKKTSATLNLIDATIKSVRRICTELRPEILDHMGLGAAIEWQAEEFQNRTGIQCEVAVEDDLAMDNDRSTALFRIFQEALTNILRHSNATKMTASLKSGDDKVILQISDNGSGITEEEISKPDSFGLLGMHERVFPWRGSVIISGSPNKGTRIEVTMPV